MENNNEKSSKKSKSNFKENFKKDNLCKKSNLLCCLALLLFVLPIIFANIINLLQNNLIHKVFIFLSVFSMFGAIGLMAYVRLKYPKNILGILLMIAFSLIMIYCGFLLVIEAKDCIFNCCTNEIRNCPG